jgi:hypothetical protein
MESLVLGIHKSLGSERKIGGKPEIITLKQAQGLEWGASLSGTRSPVSYPYIPLAAPASVSATSTNSFAVITILLPSTFRFGLEHI